MLLYRNPFTYFVAIAYWMTGNQRYYLSYRGRKIKKNTVIPPDGIEYTTIASTVTTTSLG